MTKVFYTQFTDLPSEWEGLPFSEYRLEKLSKQLNKEKREQGIAAEILLSYAVRSIFPGYNGKLEIVVNEFGKPSFTTIPLEFSLSHSKKHIACVVSDSPVGIDIEAKAKYKPEMVERFFYSDEISLIKDSDNKDYEFGRIWTAKESALKCLGTGMHRSLSTVNASDRKSVILIPEKKNIQCFHWYVNNIHCSVCLSNDSLMDEPLFVKIEL